MKRPSSHHPRSRGFGLLELILVFAVILGAGAIVFAVYRSAQNHSDADSIVGGVSLVATNVKAELDASAGQHWHGADVFNALNSPSNNLAAIQNMYATAGIVPRNLMNTAPGCPSNGSPFPVGMLTANSCLWVYLQSNAKDANGNLLSGEPMIDVMASAVSDEVCNLVLPRLYQSFPYDGVSHVMVDGVGLTSASQAFANGGGCNNGQSFFINNHQVTVVVTP